MSARITSHPSLTRHFVHAIPIRRRAQRDMTELMDDAPRSFCCCEAELTISTRWRSISACI